MDGKIIVMFRVLLSLKPRFSSEGIIKLTCVIIILISYGSQNIHTHQYKFSFKEKKLICNRQYNYWRYSLTERERAIKRKVSFDLFSN